MQAKVAEERKKEEEIYKKLMFYRKNNVGDLEGSITPAKTKL